MSVRASKSGATSLNDVLSLPRQALFAREGKSPSFTSGNLRGDWEARAVQVKYFTESRAIIEGLVEGTEVALTRSRFAEGQNRRKTGSLAAILGGAIR